MPRKKSPDFRKILSSVLILVSLGWFGIIIVQEKPTISAIFLKFNAKFLWWLALSLLSGGISAFFIIFVFKKFIWQNTGKEFPLIYLANIFFIGQIIRYLPGRFFGIVYQINETKENIPPLSILRSNIELTFSAFLFNVLVSVVIILFYKFSLLAVLVSFCAGVIIFFVYLRFSWIDIFLSLVGKILPKQASPFIALQKSKQSLATSTIIYIIMVFLINWLFYLLAWVCLQNILGWENLILLCATYTLAYAIGIASIIAPGGLGVREAAFIFLSSKVADSSGIAVVAIFIRLWLTMIDLLLGAGVFLTNMFLKNKK